MRVELYTTKMFSNNTLSNSDHCVNIPRKSLLYTHPNPSHTSIKSRNRSERVGQTRKKQPRHNENHARTARQQQGRAPHVWLIISNKMEVLPTKAALPIYPSPLDYISLKEYLTKYDVSINRISFILIIRN